MEELLNAAPEATVTVVDIQFRPGQKIYFFDPDGLELQPGDHVVMDTARGAEFGICTGGNHAISDRDVVAPLRKILRKATAQDERINNENRAREKRAFDICLQKIAAHGLDMQLVSAECSFDSSKILFYFTADERVDFRELVKDLASVFHTRIELRQIGVRDKAKMVGGLGICGRPFCCASFLDDFQPVSIKMAKTQNLSLNPTKISGTCGRLMCCLKYEQDTYEDLIRSSPKVDSFVDTPDGRGTVIESQILRQRVKVQMENNPETIGVYANEDIAVLRSGKAKKSDPPIPADLAPISGAGARPRRKKEEDASPVLESIRFRYSTENIAEEVTVDEPEAAPIEQPVEAPAEEAQPRSRRNRRRGSRPEGEEAQREPKEQKGEAVQPREQKERPPRERKPRPERKEKPKADAPQEPKPQKEPRPPKEAKEPQAEQPETGEAKPRQDRPRKPRRDNREHREPKEVREPKEPRQPEMNKPEAEVSPRPEAAEGEAKKPHRRPNYRRHRRPKAPTE